MADKEVFDFSMQVLVDEVLRLNSSPTTKGSKLLKDLRGQIYQIADKEAGEGESIVLHGSTGSIEVSPCSKEVKVKNVAMLLKVLAALDVDDTDGIVSINTKKLREKFPSLTGEHLEFVRGCRSLRFRKNKDEAGNGEKVP